MKTSIHINTIFLTSLGDHLWSTGHWAGKAMSATVFYIRGSVTQISMVIVTFSTYYIDALPWPCTMTAPGQIVTRMYPNRDKIFQCLNVQGSLFLFIGSFGVIRQGWQTLSSALRVGPHLQTTPNPAGSPHSISQTPNADRQKVTIYGQTGRKRGETIEAWMKTTSTVITSAMNDSQHSQRQLVQPSQLND